MSSSSSHRSTPTPPSGGSTDYWQKRCVNVETAMKRFHDKALDIRDKIATDMNLLEDRTNAAELKSDEAEQKCSELRDQLMRTSLMPPSDHQNQMASMIKDSETKDSRIQNLSDDIMNWESAFTDMKVKVKEWATHEYSLKQEENTILCTENENLQSEISRLRYELKDKERVIQQQDVLVRQTLHEQRGQDSIEQSTDQSNGDIYAKVNRSITPKLVKPPLMKRLESESSLLDSVSELNTAIDLGSSSSTSEWYPTDGDDKAGAGCDSDDSDIVLVAGARASGHSRSSSSSESDYQSIDVSNNKQEVNHQPPKLKIHRRHFDTTKGTARESTATPDLSIRPQWLTGLNGDHVLATSSPCRLRNDDDTDDMEDDETNRDSSNCFLEEDSPRASIKNPTSEDEGSSDADRPIPSAPSRAHKLSPIVIDDTALEVPVASKYHDDPTYDDLCNINAYATLPRQLSDKSINQEPTSNVDADTHFMDSRLAVRNAADSSYHSISPLSKHRKSSWENRIMGKAEDNIFFSSQSTLNKRDSSLPVTDKLYISFKYQSVPVYTHINKKVTLIRNNPLVDEDMASSSDDEDHDYCAVPPSTLSPEMSKRDPFSRAFLSRTSSDYALPPDENGESSSSDPYQIPIPNLTLLQEKVYVKNSGYLLKLGSRVTGWKRRYFTLDEDTIVYSKSHIPLKKVKSESKIMLDEHCSIKRNEDLLTFQIHTPKKTYYLTANTEAELENWVSAISNNLRTKNPSEDKQNREILSASLLMTKLGRSTQCWAVLQNALLIFYKNKLNMIPIGQLSLNGTLIEEVTDQITPDPVVPDPSTTPAQPSGIGSFTLAIRSCTSQDATYLLLTNKFERDAWMYHLKIASSREKSNIGTPFEQQISKLRAIDDPASAFWKHPVLLYFQEPLHQSLTTLPSDELMNNAVEMSKIIYHFTSTSVGQRPTSAVVKEIHTLFDLVLQDISSPSAAISELFAQLIKITSPHDVDAPTIASVNQLPWTSHRSLNVKKLFCGSDSLFNSSSSSAAPTRSGIESSSSSTIVNHSDDDDDTASIASRLNPGKSMMIQAWRLLSLALWTFVPASDDILWLLKQHLNTHSDVLTEISEYAAFCQRAMARTEAGGQRDTRPSQMEVVSLVMSNACKHSQPLSIPVHFLNSGYQVISFDGATTVSDFIRTLSRQIAVRPSKYSGFQLFTDDPLASASGGQGEAEHCLDINLKLCDVISKWEQTYSKNETTNKGRTVKLTFKNRLYFAESSALETDYERRLLCYQMNSEVISGRFPITPDLAAELSALMAQIEFGDHRPKTGAFEEQSQSKVIQKVISKFYPLHYTCSSDIPLRDIQCSILEKWCSLKTVRPSQCSNTYLRVLRKWPFFGSRLFHVTMSLSEESDLDDTSDTDAATPSGEGRPLTTLSAWLAVKDKCISLLDYNNLEVSAIFSYNDVLAFGGYQDDFMLVVRRRANVVATPPTVTPSGDDQEDNRALPSSTGVESSNGSTAVETVRLVFSLPKAKILDLTSLLVLYLTHK